MVKLTQFDCHRDLEFEFLALMNFGAFYPVSKLMKIVLFKISLLYR